MSKRRNKNKTSPIKPFVSIQEEHALINPSPIQNKWNALIILLFIGIGFLIYSNTFQSPFLLDDENNIVKNVFLRVQELTPEGISRVFESKLFWSRPLPVISFALNYYFGRYDVFGYHLVNIIIHIINGALLFLFLQITCTIFVKTSADHQHQQTKSSYIPFFAALLWLVHPICTQSVNYISQRMNGMTALFYLLSLLLYLKGRLSSKSVFMYFLGSFISGVFALLCKETSVTLPFFIFLYEWFFFQEMKAEWLKKKIKWISLAMIPVIAFAVMHIFGLNPMKDTFKIYDVEGFNILQLYITEFRVIILYLSLIFYPHPSRLVFDYNLPFSHNLINPLTTLISLILIIIMIGAAITMAKKNRLISFCIIWYFGNMVLEFITAPLFFAPENVFEHRLYLPSMLVCLFIILLISDLIKQHKITIIILCVLSMTYSVWTYQRNSVYKDDITLWSDTLKKTPNKIRSYNQLGLALMKQGSLDKAIKYFSIAIQMKPDSSMDHFNLGTAYSLQGHTDQAAKHFEEALRIKPQYAEAITNLGKVFMDQGKTEEAIKQYKIALNINPNLAEVHNNLGVAMQDQGKIKEAIVHYKQALRLDPDLQQVQNNLAKAIKHSGNSTEIINYFTESLRLNPNNADGHHQLGIALMDEGNVEKSIMHYKKALRINPKLFEAHYNLGNAFLSQENYKKAQVQYLESLRINPDFIFAYINLGAVSFSLRDMDQAIKYYEKILIIDPDYVDAHNNLGYVFLETKDYSQAIDHYRESLRIYPDNITIQKKLKQAMKFLKERDK